MGCKANIFLWTKIYFSIKETYQDFLFFYLKYCDVLQLKLFFFFKFLIVEELITYTVLKMISNLVYILIAY